MPDLLQESVRYGRELTVNMPISEREKKVLIGAVVAAVIVAVAIFATLVTYQSKPKLRQPPPPQQQAPLPFQSVSAVNVLGVEELKPTKPPGFAIPDIDGVTRTLDDYKGRVVLLNFWATWCEPCRVEMPHFEELHRMYSLKGLSVVAINDYETMEKARIFAKKNRLSFTVLVDESGKVSESYMAVFLPTTFIIDREGNAIAKIAGVRDWTSPQFRAYLEKLLTQGKVVEKKKGKTKEKKQ
ncbi:MAG: TlpA family protein disulfide reductase [Deltaproteobacteria bacterium]|nr:TlpA family protein disulfide reductase [Deltaproteobacteria bacterium]